MNLGQTLLLIGAILLGGIVAFFLLTKSPDLNQTSSVFFIEPQDGETVSNPVQLSWNADNFVIEPAGEFREGAGHLHIIIDAPCVSVGEIIPGDEAHIHYGGGQMETELQLPAGNHRLCLQMGDGLHRALSLTHEITVTVQ